MTPREFGIVAGLRTSVLDLADRAGGRWPNEKPMTRAGIERELQRIAQDMDAVLAAAEKARTAATAH